MRHLELYEEYSDEELNSLRSFGRDYGLIKRRVESKSFDMLSSFDSKGELDYIEDWVGPFGERIKSISGYLFKSAAEINIYLASKNSQPLMYDHIRFDARFDGPNFAKLVIFPTGKKKGDLYDVTTDFLELYPKKYPIYLQALLELYSKAVK